MPFAPTDISGLLQWLKADAGVYNDAGTTLATAGQTVRQWNDQSGNGNHVGQATSARRPVYFQQPVTGVYGVKFTKASSHYMDGSFAGGTITQPNTIYCVVQQTSRSGSSTFYDSQGGNEQVLLDNGHFTQYSGTNQASSYVPRAGDVDVLTSVFSGASSLTRRNGTSVIAANVGTQSLPNIRLGANPAPASFLDGYIYEFLIYSGAHNTTQMGQVEAYLTARWGQVFTYPASVLSYFPSDADETLGLCRTSDGTTFTAIPGVSYTAPTGVVRDPSISFDTTTGIWWLAHTDQDTTSTGFQVVSSPNGFNWTAVTAPDFAASITGINRCWSPEWFVDDDGSTHVFFAGSTTGNLDTGFQLYETHPTNAGRTTWNAAVLVTGTSLPNNMIDPFMVKLGSTYYLWYKQENTKQIEVMSSSSLTSGYTVLHSGSWINNTSGSNIEGPCLIKNAAGQWRLYVDRYSGTPGLAYIDQTDGDWTTGGTSNWSALAGITAPTTTRHGTVFPGSIYRKPYLALLGVGG